jgi:hypothetical protein
VLPSNACPLIHPDNKASDFIVSWENPVQLDPESNWKVALSELSYVYSPSTLSSTYSIKYLKYELSSTIVQEYVIKIHPKSDMKYYVLKDQPFRQHCLEYPWSVCHLTPLVTLDVVDSIDGIMQFRSKYPFKLNLSEDIRKILKFREARSQYSTMINIDGQWYLDINLTEAELNTLLRSEPTFGPIQTESYVYASKEEIFHFPSDVKFKKNEELVKYLSDRCCPHIFTTVEYNDAKEVITVSFNKLVIQVEFCNGLNFVLGFNNAVLKVDTPESFGHPIMIRYLKKFKAEKKPQLKRGIVNMYIYSSICQPIHVGHTLVPLLKNVFIDSTQDVNDRGHARNYVIYNPMYIPVSSRTFNSIEINIRNDGGQLLSFPSNSMSLLTLHFVRT